MNTIQAHWAYYKQRVVPSYASAEQIRDTRHTFYAGAAAVMLIQEYVGNEELSEAAAFSILDGLQEEIHSFAVNLQKEIDSAAYRTDS